MQFTVLAPNAKPEEYNGIADYLASTDYFFPVDPESLGGWWLVARDGEQVRGTLWWFTDGVNAYLDYFAAASPQVARRLIEGADAVLRSIGVRRVRAMISETNKVAGRIALASGMIAANAYVYVYKEL